MCRTQRKKKDKIENTQIKIKSTQMLSGENYRNIYGRY